MAFGGGITWIDFLLIGFGVFASFLGSLLVVPVMATVLRLAPRPDGPDLSADSSGASGSSFTLSSSFTAFSSCSSSSTSKFSFRLSSTIFLLSGFSVILGCWIFSSSKSNSGSFLATLCRLGRGEAFGLSCVGEMESKTLLMGWSTPTQKGLPSDPEWSWLCKSSKGLYGYPSFLHLSYAEVVLRWPSAWIDFLSDPSVFFAFLAPWECRLNLRIGWLERSSFLSYELEFFRIEFSLSRTRVLPWIEI